MINLVKLCVIEFVNFVIELKLCFIEFVKFVIELNVENFGCHSIHKTLMKTSHPQQKDRNLLWPKEL